MSEPQNPGDQRLKPTTLVRAKCLGPCFGRQVCGHPASARSLKAQHHARMDHREWVRWVMSQTQ